MCDKFSYCWTTQVIYFSEKEPRCYIFQKAQCLGVLWNLACQIRYFPRQNTNVFHMCFSKFTNFCKFWTHLSRYDSFAALDLMSINQPERRLFHTFVQCSQTFAKIKTQHKSLQWIFFLTFAKVWKMFCSGWNVITILMDYSNCSKL